MEICTFTRCIPNRQSNLTSFTFAHHITTLQLKSNSISLNYPGLRGYSYSSIKATASKETSSEANQYVKEETDDGVPVNDGQPEENTGFGGFGLFKDDAAAEDDQFPQIDFLNKLKTELDLEDSFSIALLGVGGVTALWLAANIVGSIDRIPLFPKLMELVGLGYSVWLSTRYLLFKRNRDELASKIEEIKQQVLGSKN
ncbi:protein CURVATURE THYLAKOID 1D, chloroplastic-like [Bidens hawaiensis]|uniref:protein CURVATURE THYLAKOID 1D, chloroplastic-like n=1 Tax=Bidens hawaiensis TaxID=980011 RepID=UPI00404A67C6